MRRQPTPAVAESPAPTVPLSNVIAPKEVQSMIAAVEAARKQEEEFKKKQEEMQQKLAEERAEFERQKAAYAAAQVPKAATLVQMFTPETVPLAGLPPNPLVPSTGTGGGGVVLLKNPSFVKRFKHKFLDELENGVGPAPVDAEEVLNRFVKYLAAALSAQVGEPGLSAILRKAKHGLLANAEVDGMDAETVANKFLEYLVLKATEAVGQ